MDLTKEEEAAISSLKRIAKKWPKTLWLFSNSGTLMVMKKDSEGCTAQSEGGTAYDLDYSVATIAIQNDGGGN